MTVCNNLQLVMVMANCIPIVRSLLYYADFMGPKDVILVMKDLIQ